jgi:hypothetical protein
MTDRVRNNAARRDSRHYVRVHGLAAAGRMGWVSGAVVQAAVMPLAAALVMAVAMTVVVVVRRTCC